MTFSRDDLDKFEGLIQGWLSKADADVLRETQEILLSEETLRKAIREAYTRLAIEEQGVFTMPLTEEHIDEYATMYKSRAPD